MEGDTASDHVEVIKSNKGHYKIIHRGFMYTKHKSFNNVTRWRCAARGTCRGSIMTSNDFTRPSPKMAHTHPADYKACEMAKARSFIPKINSIVFKKELFQTNAYFIDNTYPNLEIIRTNLYENNRGYLTWKSEYAPPAKSFNKLLHEFIV